jgi:aryl-alcohol dehydrogenase-like predicted oxidoreductase
MKYNRLGTSGLFVSELSFGTMTFREMEGQPTLGGLTQQDASALVAKAFEAGVNLFDTADVYALGDSESFLGEALRNLGVHRERHLIGTKAFGPMGMGPNDAGASRGHLLDAVKTSLKRLGVDHIDLYQIHGFDPATLMEETLRALDDLVRQGYVRYVGVSNWAAWQIAKALGISAHLGLSRLVLSRPITRSRGAIWSGKSSRCWKAKELACWSGVLSQAACSAASSRVARKLQKAAHVGRLHFRRSTTIEPTMLST